MPKEAVGNSEDDSEVSGTWLRTWEQKLRSNQGVNTVPVHGYACRRRGWNWDCMF